MKDSFYFQHDYNARNDQKILNLRVKYSWEGYGLFWAILEYMAENDESYINRETIGGLSLGLNYPIDKLTKFIDFCIKEGLFLEENGNIYNQRMKEHKNIRKALSDAGKRGAKKRWGNSPPNTPVKSPPNTKERKENESKEKDEILILKEFYDNQEKEKLQEYIKAVNNVCKKKYNRPFGNNSLNDIFTEFFNYWLEEDSKGKARYKKEKCFEVKKRLIRWATNFIKFNTKQ